MLVGIFGVPGTLARNGELVQFFPAYTYSISGVYL